MIAEPSALAFAVHEHEPPGLEVRVNFGMFAGREATPAEIDELAKQVLEKVSSVSIVSEERHEVDSHTEAAVHQVRIEIGADSLPEERRNREELAGRLIETAERWAHACIADVTSRSADGRARGLVVRRRRNRSRLRRARAELG